MEIEMYLRVIRRWIWLLVLMTVAAAGVTYFILQRQPITYVAQVQLLVGPGIDNANSDLNVQRASTQVMQTYSELVTTRNVMQQVIDKLHLDIGPNSLAGQITATPNTDAQVLVIAVHSANQKQAVAIANALADVLVHLSGDQVTNSSDIGAGVINTQVKQLQDIAASSQARIDQLQSDLNALSDPQKQSDIVDQQKRVKALEDQLAAPTDPTIAKQMQDHQARITQLETTLKTTVNVDARHETLDELTREDGILSALKTQVNDQKRLLLDQLGQERNRLATMQTSLSSQQNQLLSQLAIERTQLSDAQRNLASLYPTLQNGLSRQIALIDPAVNAPPEASKANLITLAAGLAGLAMALTLAFALEYLDDRIRTPEQLAQATGTRVWGSLDKKKIAFGPDQIRQTISTADGTMVEAFRRWCMNLMPASNSTVCSLLITDIEQGDSASEIASGLAVTLARAGKRTVLIDANLQRPALSQWFGAENKEGLVEWMANGLHDPKVMPMEWAPGLALLPAGSLNGNSMDEMKWPRIEELIKRVESVVDMLIIAGPPLTTSADSLFLASHASGVLVVAQRGKTRRQTARAAIDNLQALGIHVMGTILVEGKKYSFKMPKKQTPRGKSSDKKTRGVPVPSMDSTGKAISFSTGSTPLPGTSSKSHGDQAQI